jgi:hypothetical protein
MTDWARCNFDGRPMSPGDAEQVRNFLATLDARKADRGVHWRELADARDGYWPPQSSQAAEGPYWREWHCPPPLTRQRWRVAPGGEEWHGPGEDGLPVRCIYAIELAP